MSKKQDVKKAKDNEFIARGTAAIKAKKVKDNVAKAKADAIGKAAQTIVEGKTLTVVGGTMVDKTKDETKVESEHKPSQSVSASRYKELKSAEYGMRIADGFEQAKPAAAQYEVTAQGMALASTFGNGDNDTVTTAINSLGDDIANAQGKVACACAGLAYRLQRQGKTAMPFIQEFLHALEAWGKGLTMVRVNAVRSWFETMAACTYAKDPMVEGGGKQMLFDQAKFEKEAAKFGRDNEAWLRIRIAKPFWLLKPEQELKEFSFMTELAALVARAEKLTDKTTDPNKAGYRTIDLNGLSGIKASARIIAAEFKKAEAEQPAEQPAEESEVAA